MRKVIIFILLSFLSTQLYSQNEAIRLPEIIPPETAELIKFIDHPVDLAYGLANIEIPLYVIKQGDIEIPLVLKYHGSGLKVNETSHRVGMGWSLDYGPSLGRKINNAPDEKKYLMNNDGRPNFGTADYVSDILPYLRMLAGGEKDEHPDVFYYKLLSNSGKFIFNRGTPGAYTREAVIETIPFDPIKIGNGNGFNVSDIWDDKGFHYRFGYSLKGSHIYACSTTDMGNTTSWKIQEVVSPNKTDTISFRYHETKEVISTYSPEEYITVEDLVTRTNYRDDFELKRTAASQYYSISNLEFPFLTKKYGHYDYYPYNISWSDETNECVEELLNGHIFSEYGAPSPNGATRENQLKYIESRNVIIEIHDIEDITLKRDIKQITVTDKTTGEIIKTIEFTHSSFGGITDRYQKSKLDEIKIYNKNKELDQIYSFDYYNPEFVPYINNKLIDHWGYYKGRIGESTASAIPYQNISLHIQDGHGDWQERTMYIGNTSKHPGPSSQYGLLKSITFPTGRKSTFHYELNQHMTREGIEDTGGNRISKIEEYEPVSGTTTTRTFKYGLNENGAGKIAYEVSIDDYMLEFYQYHAKPNNTQMGYSKSDISKVRVYSSTPFCNPFYQNGAIVHYEHVTEYVEGKGKTEYIYNKSNFHTRRIPGTTMIIDGESDWSGGELLQKTEYKYDIQDGNYHPVRKEKNKYELFNGNFIPYGMSYIRLRKRFPNYEYVPEEAQDFQNLEGIAYETSGFSTGCKKLKQQEIVTFFGNDSVVQKTENRYNVPAHRYLTQQTVSDYSRAVTTTYKYPQDMRFSDTAEENGRTGLINNNILSPILQSEKTAGNKKWITKTKYNYVANNNIPRAVSVADGPNENDLQTKLSVEKYDKMGNPAHITENQKNIVYIWGYGGHHLIAEIQNATYSDVSRILTQTRIDRLLINLIPAKSDLDALNALRAQLPNALITTLQYKPSAGISLTIDPTGKRTTYEYDSSNRLFQVKNHDGKVIQEYTYNYRNK